MNDVKVYLYDAKGHDEQLELDDVDIGQINDKHLFSNFLRLNRPRKRTISFAS